MPSIDPWLQPLRAYPPALVLLSIMLVAAVLIWLMAKIIKWSIYLVAIVAFFAIAVAFSQWLGA